MLNSFRQYMDQETRSEDADEDTDLFRRSRRRRSEEGDEREESVDYEPGSRRREVEEVPDYEQPIVIKKKGKALLFHNIIVRMVQGSAAEIERFFRRLIQR